MGSSSQQQSRARPMNKANTQPLNYWEFQKFSLQRRSHYRFMGKPKATLCINGTGASVLFTSTVNELVLQQLYSLRLAHLQHFFPKKTHTILHFVKMFTFPFHGLNFFPWCSKNTKSLTCFRFSSNQRRLLGVICLLPLGIGGFFVTNLSATDQIFFIKNNYQADYYHAITTVVHVLNSSTLV